ncbi:DegV family EDD domain-containing protein [Streptobacillus moniliformis]|uniref:DegV family protein n=1 Tax=Streptobacillus moniliformis (strain ATCC 14647 / DSM 12112 / NCTC 10651 / 9901) TaxID=519441 RepID=D1AVV3_STRM9|nr:DegV family protein [Streptobacillus moniliformis]ACZ01863.1 degV family protein [Streptobacillus moniliformis DSM 12112]AVL43143.1 DegV family EDD domain-containing protein [Streptobacillus moniliformis]QXW65214.1 DegV family EDD domain-containing protein [Streptobacillus moniliformis]SQA12931.1 dihydroxyacetone kinase [Streptobacillus moniliformis]
MGIKYIDAKRLRRILIGGAKWVKKHEDYLNELNVYPVPDGDTGSNMSMTLETMKNDIESSTVKKSSMVEVIDVIEESILMGARGNSGTILSQIITGFLKGIGDKKRLESADLAEALLNAKEVAYKAVDTPVEGTILTVIREVSEKAIEIKDDVESLDKMLEILTSTAEEAVNKTPDLLPKLKEAGVVDSGAMGLYYFFIGISKALTEINEIVSYEATEKTFDSTLRDITHDPAEIKFKYCTEFIIRNADFNIDKFKEDILKLGDSAVFAQTSKKFKIHVHTNNPGQALELAVTHGDLEKIKIENMKLQNEGLLSSEKEQTKIFVNSKPNLSRYSYVILADSLNLKEEFLTLGASVVLLGGQSQNPSVQDILNAIAKINNNKQIVILPNNKNVISTANIAAEKTEKNVLVVPTKTMMEGYYYLNSYFDTLANTKYNAEFNYSIEITKAVRDTNVDGLTINKDDFIALVNTKIAHANKSILELIKEIKEKYINEKTINITIVEGKEKYDDVKASLNIPKSKFINGEQENYNYYIYIENRPDNMPDIAIVTDTGSDLGEEDVKGLPIFITPIRLEANGEHYKDGVDISKDEFWNKLINEDTHFKSAQPSPKELMNLYTHILNRGYKKILTLNISSSMSGTYRTVKMVRANLNKENDIIQIDTQLVSFPLGILVKQAAEKSMLKHSISDIKIWAEKFISKVKTLIVVDDLKYLERGGRITKVARSIGDFLKLKPILTFSQGTLTVEKKVFGENLAISYLEKSIQEVAKKHSIYVYSGFGGSSKQLDNISKILESVKGNHKITIAEKSIQIGATVGAHAGPVYAICMIPKLL